MSCGSRAQENCRGFHNRPYVSLSTTGKVLHTFMHSYVCMYLCRATYTHVPTFGIMHIHINHEETQSGLAPLDDGTYSHLLGAAESVDRCTSECPIGCAKQCMLLADVFLLGDHGAHHGRCFGVLNCFCRSHKLHEAHAQVEGVCHW